MYPVTSLSETNFDSFGRFRTSSPFTLFDSKQIFDNLPLYYSEAVTGTGSSTYAPLTSSSTLATSGAGTVIRQSKRYFSYQPGKSLLIQRTFSGMESGAGVVNRTGYYDGNNGIFFQVDEEGYKFCIRSDTSGTPVDTFVLQDDWNGEKFDGGVESSYPDIILDATKTQIFWIDIEWLGVGSVRCGFVIDGRYVVCHTFHHANEKTEVYMRTPNLPVRAELISTVASSFSDICTSVISEGGYEVTQSERGIDRGTTTISISATDPIPVLGLRLKSTHKGASFSPAAASVLCISGATFRWSLCLNPVLAGDALVWTDVANSAVQVANTNTQTTTITDENYLIESGYVEVGGSGGDAIKIGTSFLRPGFDLAGNSDILILAVQKISGATEQFHPSLKWIEVY